MNLITTVLTNPLLFYYILYISWPIATLFGLAFYIRKSRRGF